MKRICKGETCSCGKVKACNKFETYPNRQHCYCSGKFSFMFCHKNKAGKRVCKCRTLTEKCPPNKSVTPGRCYCKRLNNTWECEGKTGSRTCTCVPKRGCEIGERVRRNSCICNRRSVHDLMDQSAKKGRVIRAYGWVKCKLADPKDKNSERKCTCEALKCSQAGRFKKGFCHCPRLTKQVCNKKTGFCKCHHKTQKKVPFTGVFRFMGLIKTTSPKIAALVYHKKVITVWTQAGKKKQEKRYAFIHGNTGSFYIVRKPTIKKAGLEKELALYEPQNENFASIQAQLRKKDKKGKK